MPRLLCLVVEQGPYGSLNPPQALPRARPRLLSLAVKQGPSGTTSPAEAIRHAGGALGKGWEVVLAFLGNSVYTALPGQAPLPDGWLSLSEALGGIVGMGE